jgi:hypothetical protein
MMTDTDHRPNQSLWDLSNALWQMGEADIAPVHILKLANLAALALDLLGQALDEAGIDVDRGRSD